MRRPISTITSVLAIALSSLLLVLTGCGAADRAASDEAHYAPSEGGDSSGERKSTGDESTSEESTSEESSDGDSEEEEEGGEIEDPEAGQLTAGEWRDLDNWSFWLDLFDSGESEQQQEETSIDFTQFEEKWKLYTRDRIGVRVVSGEKPVVDANVELKDEAGEVVWTARTDNHGRAELYTGIGGSSSEAGALTVTATAGGQDAVAHQLGQDGDNRVILEMDEHPPVSQNLDVMFTIDTTGSMGDELSYLQSELEDVMERSRQESGRALDMRLSVNLYRDHDDNYVVRSHPFRSDVSKAVRDLDSEQASGGGDFPEAVDEALVDAIEDHEWREEATARLLFLVLDAPPHNDQSIRSQLRETTKIAARKGIRIIPVTGSGIDKSTEYLMRALDIATGGSYVFLTDHSGIGGSHIEPTIGDYDVRYLNNLLVEIIARFTKPVESVAPQDGK